MGGVSRRLNAGANERRCGHAVFVQDDGPDGEFEKERDITAATRLASWRVPYAVWSPTAHRESSCRIADNHAETSLPPCI